MHPNVVSDAALLTLILIHVGLPHRSLDDDIYNGMFIPKGSLVIANMRYECKLLATVIP